MCNVVKNKHYYRPKAMEKQSSVFWLLLILHVSASFAQHQVYIVYFGEHSGKKALHEIEEIHHSYLHSVKGSEDEAKASLIYSYKNIINGFSALLTPDEAAKLSEMEEVVSVFESHTRNYVPQTTRSWDFVDMLGGGVSNHSSEEELLLKACYGKGVIVGLLDTGIWPESPSFSDEGMEPITKSWKGICQPGVAFNTSHCNRKLIGARYYFNGYEAIYGPVNNLKDYRSARDMHGHGTHTASTAGGRRVPNASALGGFANGTASGGAPLVHLSIYKVCWAVPGSFTGQSVTCTGADMLAAFDDAISDGVDVISVSIVLGSLSYRDAISVGALHAAKRNIVVACSAGNSGPDSSTVGNVFPWVMTVAASSIDRAFPSPVLLGNGMKIQGQTVTPLNLRMNLPLVYAGDAELPYTTTNTTKGQCLPSTLSPRLVKGKIVLCSRGSSANTEKGVEVRRAGGAGIIGVNQYNGTGIFVNSHVLPGTEIFPRDFAKVLNYTRASKNPMATIIPAETTIGTKPAPVIAPFSSAGPNPLEPNILKPDITAPGLNILAAWSRAAPPTELIGDHRRVDYNILSGTSMSCPHVAAVAALLKAIHPDWSSAAIRSALMTTALVSNNEGTPITDDFENPATPFQYGAGHFQTARAADPGLIYDSCYTDYLLFLCSSGLRDFDRSFKCPKKAPTPSDLNYPSLAISGLNGTVMVARTVTNVGASKSVYNLTLETPIGYSVSIYPTTLHFKHLGEKKNFTITIGRGKSKKKIDDQYSFGWYMWSDGIHMVRSPIAVSKNKIVKA